MRVAFRVMTFAVALSLAAPVVMAAQKTSAGSSSSSGAKQAKQRTSESKTAAGSTDQAPSSQQPPVFENDKVRVFRYELAPGAELVTEEHKTEHLIIPIGEVTLVQGAQRMRARSGEVQILKRGVGERLTNTGTAAAVVVSVDLLAGPDIKAALCGLEGVRCDSILGGDLKGGSWGINTLLKTVTVEIANGEIDPQVTTDELKRSSPMLRVAITPLKLAEQVGDEEPKMMEQAPGDVTWVPVGAPVTIKNMETSKARYVMVTFR